MVPGILNHFGGPRPYLPLPPGEGRGEGMSDVGRLTPADAGGPTSSRPSQCAAAVLAPLPTTSHRATTLNTSDITSRISATSTSADGWSSPVASANSFASRLDIV